MADAKIRKGFPRVTVNDVGGSTKTIELVCTDHTNEESVVQYLETQGYQIGNGDKWRTESISVAPSPLSLPANANPGVGTGDADRVVYFATVVQTLLDPFLIVTNNSLGASPDYDRLLASTDLVQSGGTRLASVMKKWPSDISELPLDPWFIDGEDIRVDKDLAPIDINGQPVREPVAQMTYTVTNLERGNFANYDIRDQLVYQGTRNQFAVASLNAEPGQLLLISVSCSRVNSSMVKITHQFLWDKYKHLDMEPFSPFANQKDAYREETPNNKTAVETGSSPKYVFHNMAMWVSRTRVSNWNDLRYNAGYVEKLVTGQLGP